VMRRLPRRAIGSGDERVRRCRCVDRHARRLRTGRDSVIARAGTTVIALRLAKLLMVTLRLLITETLVTSYRLTERR